MKHFLLRLLLFSTLLLLSHVGALGGVLFLSKRALDRCRLGSDVDSLIVGDSHVMWAIDDARIPGLRNISLNGEGYRYSLAKLEHVLGREKSIERVYVGVGYHNFSHYFDHYIYGASFKLFAYRYLPFFTLDDCHRIAGYGARHLLGLSTAVVVDGVVPGLKGTCEAYGGFPAEKQTQILRPASVRKRLDSQFFEGGHVIEKSAVNIFHLRRIVALCRARGLALTVLTTPVHQTYEAGVPMSYRRMLSEFVMTTGLEHYDFRDLTLPDSSFLPDGDHLNYEGAVRATQKFLEYHSTQKKITRVEPR